MMESLGDYYDRCRASAAAAAGMGGLGAVGCRIGLAALRLTCGNARLRGGLLRPLPLGLAPAGDGALDVVLAETGVDGPACPPIPWVRQGGAPDSVERCRADGIEAIVEGPADTLTMLHGERREAVYWVRMIEGLPVYERCAPLRPLLQWWLDRSGLQLVHGAAVGTREGGVLLVGRGGSGKSTTALACLGSDLYYAGDDYVAVAGRSVCRVYSTAKMDARTLELLPHLRDLIENPGDLGREKGYALLEPRYGARLAVSMPLRAIVVPRVAGVSPPRFRPIGRAQALAALAPSTLFQRRSTAPGCFDAMTALVKALPCYLLDVGPGLGDIPGCLTDLIGEAAARGEADR